MGVLEKNRPQTTSKSTTSNTAAQKPQAKAAEKSKASDRSQDKVGASGRKSDEGTKKSKTIPTSTGSKTSVPKVCIFIPRNRHKYIPLIFKVLIKYWLKSLLHGFLSIKCLLELAIIDNFVGMQILLPDHCMCSINVWESTVCCLQSRAVLENEKVLKMKGNENQLKFWKS